MWQELSEILSILALFIANIGNKSGVLFYCRYISNWLDCISSGEILAGGWDIVNLFGLYVSGNFI